MRSAPRHSFTSALPDCREMVTATRCRKVIMFTGLNAPQRDMRHNVATLPAADQVGVGRPAADSVNGLAYPARRFGASSSFPRVKS